MNSEETIDVLNELIQINNDRIEGYETAAKETEEGDLKVFFADLQKTSLQCKEQLSAEVVKLGGTPTDDTKLTGKFFRVWMDVKAAINGKDRKAILESCEYGEDVAQETYQDVLEDEQDNLSEAQIAIIQAQYLLLQADHEKVKFLRDTLVDV